MNCSKCGSKIVDGKNFCSQCGTPVRIVPHTSVHEHGDPLSHTRSADLTRTRTMPAEPGGYRGSRRMYRADIVFAFDSTGSMGPYIEGLKNTVIGFSHDLEDNHIDVRLGLVEYRDLKCGEPINNHGFAGSAERFRGLVGGLKDEGGGDEPESAIDALCEALNMPFRDNAARIIALITDASYHEPGENGATMEDVCQRLRAEKVVAYVIGPDLPGYVRLTDSMGGILFNIESDPEGFRQIVKSLGKSISETVPRLTDVRTAADAALSRTRVR